MAKMKSCGSKGYAEGGDVEGDMSEKRSATRKAPPARTAAPRLPRGIREEDIVPRYEGSIRPSPSTVPPSAFRHGLEMNQQNRAGENMDNLNEIRKIVPRRLKEGGAIRGTGIESKGKTKGRFV